MSWAASIASKMWLKLRGITPRSSAGLSFPSMVCDLPVPVWPYAEIVPLYPSRVESTIVFAVVR